MDHEIASVTGEPTVGARRRPSGMVIALVSWFVGALIFFRASFQSGFDKIAGNVGDARLIAVLHEHWVDVWNCVLGAEPRSGAEC